MKTVGMHDAEQINKLKLKHHNQQQSQMTKILPFHLSKTDAFRQMVHTQLEAICTTAEEHYSAFIEQQTDRTSTHNAQAPGN